MSSHQQIQIFLSYAREDYAVVRQLYNRLRWMDKVDLSKGADFAKAIPKVLRESDLLIVCLSPRSVEKRSFIQREINLALDAWEQMLDDDLYIFPVRLEECKAPDRISKFNWTDLFGEEHDEEWNALLQALRAQAQRLGKALLFPSEASTESSVSKPLPKSITENLNGIPLEMILVPAGKFTMGGTIHDIEKPPHEVTVPSFYIGKYQVTQKQWQAVLGKNPSHFNGDDLPAENISWTDVKEFCLKLSELTKSEYRVPSEAEWEYTCRAGTTGDYAGKLDFGLRVVVSARTR